MNKINIYELLDYIPTGKENAISKYKLAEMFNMKTDRTIRNAIEQLRKEGNPICSDTINGGYYIAKDKAEASDYLSMEYSRMKTVISNTKNLFKVFENKFGNFNLELPLEY